MSSYDSRSSFARRKHREDPVPDRRAGLAAVWTSRGQHFALPVVGMTGKLHTRSNEQDGSAASSDEGGMAAEKRVDGTLYLLPVQTRAHSVLCHCLARSHLFALGVLRRPVAGDGEQRAAASSAWAVEPRDMGCLAWTNPHSRLAVRADEDLGASHTYPSPSSTAPSMRCDEMGQPSAANERRRPAPPSQAHLEKEWALALAGGHNGQIRGRPGG
ncbi:hypothetical protein ACCO45_007062 [Purpureocillium lilacinum]|uniref:Uncharacterized protein n=1 Tax=Purpureocillium lilacinum TaxID=33203 RepID=A0ACC4DRB0_PURLI